MRKIIFILCLILSSCGSGLQIPADIRSYSDPDKVTKLAKLNKFSLASINSFEPLKEKEILSWFKGLLVYNGYVYSEKNPDFIVSIDFSIDPMQVSGTRLVPRFTPGTTSTTSGYVGSILGGSFNATTMTPGQMSFVPVPYEAIVYHSAILLTFTSPEGVPLWRGEAESTSGISDIVIVASYLLDELLAEFPYKTGKAAGRYIEVICE